MPPTRGSSFQVASGVGAVVNWPTDPEVSPMRRSLSLLALLALAGCETVEMLQNDKVLAGVLLATPDATVGTTDVPGTVTAQVFFGQISGAMSGSADVDPIAGATVQVSWTGGGTATLTPGAAGYYEATGGALVYVEGAQYTFHVSHGGETYTGTVTAPPSVEMRDAGGALLDDVVPVTAAGLADPYPVCRTGNQVAFVTVQEFTDAGASGEPCFVPPAPTDAGGIIGLLFDDGEYRAACFSLPPATCFPNRSDPGTVGYLVGLTALNKATGTQMSSNLFLGSGVFVGTMDASALVLSPPP